MIILSFEENLSPLLVAASLPQLACMVKSETIVHLILRVGFLVCVAMHSLLVYAQCFSFHAEKSH